MNRLDAAESARGFGLVGLLILRGSIVGLSSPFEEGLCKKSSSSGLPLRPAMARTGTKMSMNSLSEGWMRKVLFLDIPQGDG